MRAWFRRFRRPRNVDMFGKKWGHDGTASPVWQGITGGTIRLVWPLNWDEKGYHR